MRMCRTGQGSWQGQTLVGGGGAGGVRGAGGGPAADEGRLHCGGSISPTQQRLQSISRQGLQPLDGLVFCHWEGGLAGTFLGHPPPPHSYTHPHNPLEQKWLELVTAEG